jgi:thiamine biosynthesis lipoprotein
MRSEICRRAKPLLGTLVEVQLHGSRDEAAVRDAFVQIERVHRSMNRHAPDSDISRFNALAVGESVDADPWTLDVLVQAERLRHESGGIFDCNELAEEGREAGEGDRAPAWIIDGGRITKLRPARLDLGGIAKGHAVDHAIEALAHLANAGHVLVNAGGDLRHCGPLPVRVAVRDPADAGRIAVFHDLRGEALASSSAGGLAPRPGMAPRILDRRGGKPLAPSAGVSVLAPTCMLADALTKVALLADAASRQALLSRHGARVLLDRNKG